MSAPGIEVVNFGCRLNHLETATMARQAHAAGKDNLVIVNTCAVTAEAIKQARQAIRRATRTRPDAEVVVTGCGIETEPGRFADLPGIARIVPNRLKTEPSIWGDGVVAAPAPIQPLAEAGAGRTRAFMQVQNGCDHACTFCIIPAGRGAARSVQPDAAVAAVRRLVEVGAVEVVLTGVDLTSWGGDLGPDMRLGDLVLAILAGVPDLQRLRLSSIDSVEVDTRLMQAVADEPRLMPHLHLSLQAGDDLILKRMRRRHRFVDAVQLCDRLRALRPDIVFGADLIAGFPTESEEMFARSIDLVEACGLTHLHVFPYSPRPGTPAARMPQVPGTVARHRAARLRERGAVALAAHLDRQIGRLVDVLTENGGIGRAPDFTAVRVPPGSPAGAILPMRLTGHDGTRCTGVAVGEERLVTAVMAG